MNIRYANENDSSLLAELGRKTFYDSFIEHNTPEDMAKYLSEHYSTEIQMSEIKDPDTVFLIAETNSIPVGYVKLKGKVKVMESLGLTQWSYKEFIQYKNTLAKVLDQN